MTGLIGTLAVGLLLGTGGREGSPADAGVSLEQFIPAGWEVGDCPAAYGPDSVLCGGTDSGPFKVDHHVARRQVRWDDRP